MAFVLKYFDEVDTDIAKAKIWYKEQKLGLEIEFASAIEQTLKQIVAMPEIFAIRYRNIRIAHPKKFPFKIHFYIDEPRNEVIITAIIHNKRHPKIGTNRMN